MSYESDLISELERMLLKESAFRHDQVILPKALASSDPMVREKLVLAWDKHVTQPSLKWLNKLGAEKDTELGSDTA